VIFASAQIGFLVAPGNPTVEPEMQALCPTKASQHFTRLSASGPAGTHAGQEDRNLGQAASAPEAVQLLAMLLPAVIALAHMPTNITVHISQQNRGSGRHGAKVSPSRPAYAGRGLPLPFRLPTAPVW